MFIKSLIKSVFVILTFLVLIIGSFFSIVYYDYSYYGENNFQVDILYVNKNLIHTGIAIDFIDSEFNENSLRESSLIINSSKNNIFIKMDRVFFEDTIKDNTYDFYKILGVSNNKNLTFLKTQSNNLTFKGYELIQILESNQLSKKVLVIENLIKLQGEFNNIKSFIFSYLILDSLKNPKNIITLIDSIKDEKITIEPKRLSFSLIEYIPTKLITNNIGEFNLTEHTLK